MYTFSADMPRVCFDLTPEMIDHTIAVAPVSLVVDVPLQYSKLPENVQKAILRELAMDVSMQEKDICRESIIVCAGVSCMLNHPTVTIDDDICISVCAEVMDKDGKKQNIGTILHGIEACIDGNSTEKNTHNTYISYIMQEIRTLVSER